MDETLDETFDAALHKEATDTMADEALHDTLRQELVTAADDGGNVSVANEVVDAAGEVDVAAETSAGVEEVIDAVETS
eukprot:CAMPEP_0194037076 /NCGR_PEP_ID=MMETSP0009_2-20130614/9423_1 /TAXON_ID=210454 /ORGANISM="Grammatophora oceanica, Strain CCMP 410" /LENGTH=77 /DNA_ID=CAMNT_0038679079 /DNA_START=61 /DNA_END=291 /DNA_ORIENTATION=-